MGILDSLFGGGLSTIFGSTANSVQPNVNADAGSGGMQTSLTPAATTPTPSPQPGTGPAVQPAMSDQDALKMIPDTINMGELASLQMKNASSDPASYAQKLNDAYWNKKYDFGQMGVGQAGSENTSPNNTQQISANAQASENLNSPPIRQSIGERASDPSYKFYDHDAAQKKDFVYKGALYHVDDNGKMFMAPQGELNDSIEMSPSQAASIRGELAQNRAKTEYYRSLDYTGDGSLGIAARGEDKGTEDFARGLVALPGPGDPYAGKSGAYSAGRILGSLVPGWDDGRQAGVDLYGMGTKYYNGEHVPLSDWANAGEHGLKAGIGIAGSKLGITAGGWITKRVIR